MSKHFVFTGDDLANILLQYLLKEGHSFGFGCDVDINLDWMIKTPPNQSTIEVTITDKELTKGAPSNSIKD